jgi:hypothetical protein
LSAASDFHHIVGSTFLYRIAAARRAVLVGLPTHAIAQYEFGTMG